MATQLYSIALSLDDEDLELDRAACDALLAHDAEPTEESAIRFRALQEAHSSYVQVHKAAEVLLRALDRSERLWPDDIEALNSVYNRLKGDGDGPRFRLVQS